MTKRLHSELDPVHAEGGSGAGAVDKRSGSPSPAPKRLRLIHDNLFKTLSDELILKIFSYVGSGDLTRCQQVCQRFLRIAGDNQLWKSAYYDKFTRPRISRLTLSTRFEQDFRRFKWADEAREIAKNREAHWKKIYKLRHNWNQGSAGVSEIGMPHSEQLLSVKMRGVCHFFPISPGPKLLNPQREWSSR